MELSIVIPVYNEGSHIAETLPVIASYADKTEAEYKLIVVDDGSADDTWQKVISLKERFPRLEAIRLSRNFGKEAAICAGLDAADSDAVIIMDSDLQHPPELIPAMVSLWRLQQVDIVNCVKQGGSGNGLAYRMSTAIFYWLLQTFSGYNLSGASDYKLLSSKALEAWRQFPESKTFFRGMIASLGFAGATIEFTVPQRVEGNSKWSLTGLVGLAVKAIVAFSSIPLYLIAAIGALFLVGAFFVGMEALYNKFIGVSATGFTTVILLLLIVGGIIMVSLGIMGYYLSAVYQEVKRRPRFLISETTERKSG